MSVWTQEEINAMRMRGAEMWASICEAALAAERAHADRLAEALRAWKAWTGGDEYLPQLGIITESALAAHDERRKP